MILSPKMPFHRLAISLACLHSVSAAPIGAPDLYSTAEDEALTVPAAGVLDNDDANGAPGGIVAAKVSDPAHGTVSLAPDGSFTYTPAANFSGTDSFQYKAIAAPAPVLFTVDQANSTLTVNAQTNVSGVTDSKTDTAAAKGTLTAKITPTQSPFSSARIQTMDVVLAEQLSLTMCVAKVVFCIGTLTARVEPDGLVVSMREDQAGPAGTVTGGTFTQNGNSINAVGTMFLSTGGAAGLVDIPPQADLNTTTAYDFTNATITQSGSTLVLSVPIDITQVLTDPQYSATVRVTGTIRATAPVPAAPEESATTTVSLEVIAVDDAPVAGSDRYYTRQNHAISIPATGSEPATETLITAGSVWKYSTGASLGTAWRTFAFDDTSWSSGAGVLGYDTDNPIATPIPARADMAQAASAANPNYPTAYFRREFNVSAVPATVEARIEFQRDDACIIYLNGTEIYRDSTPYTGATAPLAPSGDIPYSTYAAAGMTPDSDGAVYKSVTFSPSLLREGKNVFAAEVHQQNNTSSDLRFDLRCLRTTAPTQTLIDSPSPWKYATGTDLGIAWRSADYNDATWSSASGPLGYDTDISAASTIPARGNTAEAASAANPNYPTAYFRKEFTLTTPYDTLLPRVEFQRDDACIIYVNGIEIYRDTAFGAGEVPYSRYTGTTISEAESISYKRVTFSRSLLREGRNVIAAEVHQAALDSSDLRFDLKAYRTTGIGGLTVNDTDVDGPAFNVRVHRAPAHGTASLNADGSFTYLPSPGFPATGDSGTDTFVYRHTIGGTPIVSTSVISPIKATWSYLDTGVAAPQDANISAADWRNAAFDDSTWKTGIGEFGYGDNDEATVVEDDATAGSPTAGSTTRFITTYFRRKFDYTGSTELLNRLQVRMIRDDGIAIFLNGTRIVRANLPEGWTFLTTAPVSINGADETTPVTILDIPASALRSGENILAAEIHQNAATSSDISFDMELIAESVAGAVVEIIVLNDDLDNDNVSDTWERAYGIDASVANADADADGDGQSNRAEFLAGTDPTVFGSRLTAGGITSSAANQLQLRFSSVPGRTYQLQESAGLSGWQDIGSPFPAHSTASETMVQFAKPAAPNQFYRVRVANDWQ